jgi:glutamate-1-semialdehyde aminotransferase
VRFCGAYHGWWGDVQPGIGNPLPAHETYTLKDMSEDSLRVLRTRRDIACVLVNPLQALHPNAAAPTDSSLVDGARSAHFDKDAYADWLTRLRAVCTEQNIVLIFDEVFVGFRLAVGGAQEYFGVRADLVTYGKTLGGGLPSSCAISRRHARANSIASLIASGMKGRSGSTSACARKRCRSRWRTCPRSGRSLTCGRRATTGCCNTICAPKGWRSAGSEPPASFSA